MGFVVTQAHINRSYALAKDKDGKWKVAMWINDALFARDGSNKRLCKRDDMTRWKFFSDVLVYETESSLAVGDRVGIKDGRVLEYFYVIDPITVPSGSKVNKYYIGI